MKTVDGCIGSCLMPCEWAADPDLILRAAEAAINAAIDEILRQGANVTGSVKLTLHVDKTGMADPPGYFLLRAEIGCTPIDIGTHRGEA